MCDFEDRDIAAQTVQKNILCQSLVGAGQFPGTLRDKRLSSILLDNMGADRGCQLINEKLACSVRLLQRRDQRFHKIGENRVA